jgi:hypothetical protein
MAVDADDNVWATTYGSRAVVKFDNSGKPLSPPEGYNFNGQLGLMQGIIVTPSGDVWALGVSKSDPAKARIICEGRDVEPCKSFIAPFHLAIDQQDRTRGRGDRKVSCANSCKRSECSETMV